MSIRLLLGGRLLAALVLALALVLGLGPAARAQAPPAYMDIIMDETPITPTQAAERSVLDLDVAKSGHYARVLQLYR